MTHYSAIVIGGGQAGIAASHYLQQHDIDHLVLEKHRLTHTWREQRWDTFCLVTPNWQCALPGYPYTGQDPHGFMKKDEIIAYLDGYIAAVKPPAREGVTVQRLARRAEGGFALHTSAGAFSADQVIVASGGYHTPIIPRLAERLPAGITQLHSEQYRNPAALPAGAVLVVGSGQSGAQIAEDLHLAGRQVHLAVGDAPRCARFYRGKDVVDWLAEMGYYDIGVDTHPLREGVRDNTNHYVTGRDGGRDIDLRRFAAEGMRLHGRLEAFEGNALRFAGNLGASLDAADAVYNRINASIDQYISAHGIEAPPGGAYQPGWQPAAGASALNLAAEGISTVIWCIGFTPDFSWVELPVFNGKGYPGHVRGVSAEPGLYFLGLPWLYTWGSGRFSGVARDAEYVVEHLAGRV
ncbi:MSMEG_0569 family flavin-dependent oxidoreductase [Pseudomonas sp. NPDC007930]|uniref:MSMEG_0569 family flavin-dependent oxidoreductase n=1 Tax=Pseudomonas sp. NPDC007930 TaxID=3364417 RepID=UPI0036E1EFA9